MPEEPGDVALGRRRRDDRRGPARPEAYPPLRHLLAGRSINDLYVGGPVKLGAGGIEEIIELDLEHGDLDDLDNSANDVCNIVEVLHS